MDTRTVRGDRYRYPVRGDRYRYPLRMESVEWRMVEASSSLDCVSEYSNGFCCACFCCRCLHYDYPPPSLAGTGATCLCLGPLWNFPSQEGASPIWSRASEYGFSRCFQRGKTCD